MLGTSRQICSVAFKGKQGIVRHHAAPVVGDLNQLPAAAFHLDFDARGSGVQRILEQFLQNRGRTLHHLPGGDLVGHVLRKQVNASHRIQFNHKGHKGTQLVTG